MTAGPIEPFPRARVEDRRDCRLPTAWIQSAEPTTPDLTGHWLTRGNEPTTHEPVEDGPVLVMLASASSPALAALEAHGRAGARVYVLAPSHWKPTDPALLRCPTVLVRRVAEVPASAVHAADGAHVWMGAAHGGPAPWRLRLDDEQAEALRQLFVRMFWHDAIDEAWTGGKGPTFRTAAERPFDVAEPTTTAVIRVVKAGSRLDPPEPDQRVHLDGGAPPSASMKRLWFPPSGSDHAALARLVREGATVIWEERELPDLATDGQSGTVLLPGARGRLRIQLSRAQAAEAARLLDGPSAWAFGLDTRLGDHEPDGAKLWLHEAKNAGPVEPEQVIDLPDVQAPELRDMDDASPTSWPAPHPLSSMARYRWTVRPPRVPASAKVDPLVGRWRELDAGWAVRLEDLRRTLAAANDHRGHLGKTFARLMSALLGFERTHGGLLGEVTALARRRPSEAGPTEADGLFERLAKLEEQAIRLRTEQEDAGHQARVDDERDRQREAWTARVEAAGRDLPRKRSELEATDARRPAISGELAEVEHQLESPGVDKKTRKDLKARRKKLNDDLALHGRLLGRCGDELAHLEQQANEPFTFTPPARTKPAPKSSGGRFVPTSTERAAIIVPEEALPEVGILRHLGGQRYLVIDAWEHLEPGERAAQRLRARLVAPEDA